MRRGNYRRMYGVTIADYDALFTLQGGKCAICQSTDPGGGFQHFAVDHDHSTSRIRGLLCVAYNRGLGLFRDIGGSRTARTSLIPRPGSFHPRAKVTMCRWRKVPPSQLECARTAATPAAMAAPVVVNRVRSHTSCTELIHLSLLLEGPV